MTLPVPCIVDTWMRNGPIAGQLYPTMKETKDPHSLHVVDCLIWILTGSSTTDQDLELATFSDILEHDRDQDDEKVDTTAFDFMAVVLKRLFDIVVTSDMYILKVAEDLHIKYGTWPNPDKPEDRERYVMTKLLQYRLYFEAYERLFVQLDEKVAQSMLPAKGKVWSSNQRAKINLDVWEDAAAQIMYDAEVRRNQARFGYIRHLCLEWNKKKKNTLRR